MKKFRSALPVLFLCMLVSSPAFAADSSSGAVSEIKSGFRKIVRGGAKGVKKAAQKVETKMDRKLNKKSD